MTSVLAFLSWVINNWQMLATAFSSISSIALFFMHGNAAQELAELQTFIDSLQVSQTPIQSQIEQQKKT